MPRKKSESTEAKKSRKGSKDSRVNSSPAAEILPPPMPTESHLVASNPFDDVPSSPMHTAPNPRFQGHQGMHGGMVSPPFGPMAPANWNPRQMRPGYGSPNWGPMGGEMGHMNYQGMPPQQQLSPNGFGMNPGMMGHPGMGPHPGYRGQIRMPRDGMGSPLHPKFQRIPGMQGMGNPGHLPPQVKPYTSGPSGRKGSLSGEGTTKTRKEPKSRKKSKNLEKTKSLDVEAKAKMEAKNETPKLNPAAPHATPPNGPQICLACKRDINYPAEDCIQCLASCNNWYHRTCSGLTKSAHCHLQSEEYALWACDSCISNKEINSVRFRDLKNALDNKQNILVASS